MGSAFGCDSPFFPPSPLPLPLPLPFGPAFGCVSPFPPFSACSVSAAAFGFGAGFGFTFADGFGRPLVPFGSFSASCATAAFGSDLAFGIISRDARIDGSLVSSLTSISTSLISFTNQSHDWQCEVSRESLLMRSMWRCNNLNFLTLEYNQVNLVVSDGWCDCGMALSTYSMRSTNLSRSRTMKLSNCKSSKACWVRLLPRFKSRRKCWAIMHNNERPLGARTADWQDSAYVWNLIPSSPCKWRLSLRENQGVNPNVATDRCQQNHWDPFLQWMPAMPKPRQCPGLSDQVQQPLSRKCFSALETLKLTSGQIQFWWA